MTGTQVYKRALSFLMEKEDEDKAFSAAALDLINAGIAELNSVQKSICDAEGEEFIPAEIEDLEDEIRLRPVLCRLLPIYLASEFFRDNMDDENSRRYYSRFESAAQRLMRARVVDISCDHGGDADV